MFEGKLTKKYPAWIFSLFLFLGICGAQQFSFSTDIGEQQRQPRREQQLFPQRGFFGGGDFRNNFGSNAQASASASAGGSSSSSASSSSGNNFPISPGGQFGINSTLQLQFREIFDWNKDLASDPRFQTCTVPDIGGVERACPKRAFYFGLNPQHRMAVGMVKQILTNPHNAQQTVCLAGAMRDLPGMNPNVWIRGMLGAHLSDVGLFDLEVPPMVEVMPHIFLSRESLQLAKRQATFNPGSRRCTVIDGSVGADNGVENRLWYFREDIFLNSFHLNWHLIYPFTGITRKADRQGELFYFSHHSHIARYQAERLSNKMSRVTPLDININTPVPEPYNPHLDDTNSAMSWTARRPNRPIQDTVFINITGVPPNISVADRVLHVRRIEEAIRNGALLLPNGGRLPLDSRVGIDILGDTVEASIFTPNGDYYGQFGFHNEGHVLLSLIEDPRNLSGIPPGIMLEVATAMRDPVFYTYHAAMDRTFDLHKQALPPYEPERGELPLIWDGVEISSVEVRTDNGSPNELTTFFGQRTFELSRGLDFNRSGVQGSVRACVTHLNHTPFTYQIYANRQSRASGRATVRIFLAPRFDENGRRFSLTEQRILFFMLDLFTVQLNPGVNRITRRSRDSALTIEIPQGSQIQTPPRIKGPQRATYCGCGWPSTLLLPRGSDDGMTFDLFVMLTNGNEDYVRPRNSLRRPGECKPAPIYCGRLNDTYPDSRPMGYPFDRLPYNVPRNWWENPSQVENLDEYIGPVPNMATTRVRITHIRGNPQNSVRFEEDPLPISNTAPQTNVEARPFQFEPNTNNGPVNFDTFQEQGNANPSPAAFENFETVPLIHQEHEHFSEEDSEHNHDPDFHRGSSNYYNNFFRRSFQGGANNYRSSAYFISPAQQYAYSA